MIYSFKSICTTISVKNKKICTKQGIMTLLYRQKNTTRCKQRNTLSGNERKKTLIYSFNSICTTISVKDKKISTKQRVMSSMYRQKNTTRCEKQNTLSGNEQEQNFLCFLQMQRGCQEQNSQKKQILHEMGGKFSFFFTFLL